MYACLGSSAWERRNEFCSFTREMQRIALEVKHTQQHRRSMHITHRISRKVEEKGWVGKILFFVGRATSSWGLYGFSATVALIHIPMPFKDCTRYTGVDSEEYHPVQETLH